MKAIHILRKPCSESTVAANVLRWGTGALNIDACRVGTANDVPSVHATRKSDYPQSYTGDGAGWGRTRGGYAGDEVHWEPKGGRWPANLVLQHLEGCKQMGTKRIKGSDRPGHGHERSPVHIIGPNHRHSEIRHGDEDGTETVAAYECAPGCPVAALDEQSGAVGGGAKARVVTKDEGRTDESAWRTKPIKGTTRAVGDTGGASRYFKQFTTPSGCKP